jgi:hypothetical protein
MNELRKRVHDNTNGLDYVLVGDYYIPDLHLPEESRPIGRYGQMHRDYIKEHKSGQYTNLTLSCKLYSYLADIDEQAEERLEIIMEQMAKTEGVTEQLKADNQMLWIQKMNNIRHRAEEIVLKEIVYS